MKYVREFTLLSAESIYCSAKQEWLHPTSFHGDRRKGRYAFEKPFLSSASGAGATSQFDRCRAARSQEVDLKENKCCPILTAGRGPRTGLLCFMLWFVVHSSRASKNLSRSSAFHYRNHQKTLKPQDIISRLHSNFQRKTIMKK